MSRFIGPKIANNNLVLYVDAANSRRPAFGNTTLTANGGLSSPANGYYTFDGSDDSLSVNNSGTIYNVSWTAGKTILVGAWLGSGVVYSGSPIYRAMLGTPDGNSRLFNFYIYVDSGGYKLHFSAGIAGQPSDSSFSSYLTGVTTQTWYVWGVSQAADGTIKYWQNGNIVNITSQNLTGYAVGTEYLGRADNFWSGRIGFWQIYNTCLTDDQIKQNYNAVRSRYAL